MTCTFVLSSLIALASSLEPRTGFSMLMSSAASRLYLCMPSPANRYLLSADDLMRMLV